MARSGVLPEFVAYRRGLAARQPAAGVMPLAMAFSLCFAVNAAQAADTPLLMASTDASSATFKQQPVSPPDGEAIETIDRHRAAKRLSGKMILEVAADLAQAREVAARMSSPPNAQLIQLEPLPHSGKPARHPAVATTVTPVEPEETVPPLQQMESSIAQKAGTASSLVGAVSAGWSRAAELLGRMTSAVTSVDQAHAQNKDPARVANAESAPPQIRLAQGARTVSAPPRGNGRSNGGRISDNVWIDEGESVRHVTLTLNKSRTFRVDRPFSTLVVGSQDIADVLPLSDQSFYIQAKKIGTTNVSFVDAGGRLVGILDLEVAPDTLSLQQSIRSSTGASGVRVSSVGGQVVLSGTAVDAVTADRAVSVARGMSLNGEVVNAMQVAAPQQVMLEVRFLEASRSAGRDLGVNLNAVNRARNRGASTGFGGAVQLPNPPVLQPAFEALGTLVGNSVPFGTVLTRLFTGGGYNVDALITALEDKGVVRRLAEPNLVALSGDTARFLAGGEFPVPVGATNQAGQQTITIEFKKFGIELEFTPTVLAKGQINLHIAPSVSELDFTRAVTLAGTQIPALTKRDARTTVELRDGQSFAIAGLLSSQNRREIAQVPWIGSIPIIGALFRSAEFQQEETDLVIIVTPRLVQPSVPGQRIATPLDSRLPSNDADFFLLGQPEVKKRYHDYVTAGGHLEGPYGHMIQPAHGYILPVIPKAPAHAR